MEGNNGCDLNFGSCFTNHHPVLPDDRNLSQTNFSQLIDWIQTGKMPPTSLHFSPMASTIDMISVVPATSSIDGVSEIHGEIAYDHPGGSYSSKPTASLKGNMSGSLSKPRPSSSSRRGYSTDRQRRIRIAEKLEALQELLPQASKGNQASVLDDVIDHIKHLQLQIKDLSQSKIGGELSSEPFIFVEGYGHYMNHEEMQGEPLEEMVGKLLEVDPSAAAQLLENKGLFMIPMDFVEGLC